MLVRVEWLDAHCALERITRSEAALLKPVTTVAIGHLVARTPAGITIAVDAYPDDPDTFHAWHFIGAGMVVEVRELSSTIDQ